jgi:hypothetical protein
MMAFVLRDAEDGAEKSRSLKSSNVGKSARSMSSRIRKRLAKRMRPKLEKRSVIRRVLPIRSALQGDMRMGKGTEMGGLPPGVNGSGDKCDIEPSPLAANRVDAYRIPMMAMGFANKRTISRSC